MGILKPEAVVRLWNEMLDEARKNKTGPFGWKNSDAFLKKDDSGTLPNERARPPGFGHRKNQ